MNSRFNYHVPVVHFQAEKEDEIRRKGMVILLPFKLLSLRKEIAKSRSPENVKRLIDLYENEQLATMSEQLAEKDEKLAEKDAKLAEMEKTIRQLKERLA